LFDNQKIVLNADLIEFVEETPDTIISLTDGKKVMVKETVDQVIDSIVTYKRLLSMPFAKSRPRAVEATEASAPGDRGDEDTSVTYLRAEEQ
jgi:flagellar protein FlbD